MPDRRRIESFTTLVTGPAILMVKPGEISHQSGFFAALCVKLAIGQ